MNAFCFASSRLRSDDFRLVIRETTTMQERDQASAAFINAAKFLRDKSADRSRRARQLCCDKSFQLLLLRAAELAGGALMAKPRQPSDPIFLVKTKPASNRGVVNEQNHGELLKTQAIV